MEVSDEILDRIMEEARVGDGAPLDYFTKEDYEAWRNLYKED